MDEGWKVAPGLSLRKTQDEKKKVRNANRNERSRGRPLLHGQARTPTEQQDHRNSDTVTGGGWWLGWWLVAVVDCRLAVGGWWRLAADGGWWLVVVGSWQLAVDGGWLWMAAGGGWRLVVLGGCPYQKKMGVLKDSPGVHHPLHAQASAGP